MRILEAPECREWLSANGVHIAPTGNPVEISEKPTEQFSIPSDTGRRIALVRQHMEHFRDSSAVLVWITEWGVWPSSERMHIFQRFRLSYGVDRSLHDGPGHLFSRDEFEDCISLATLAVLFLWDCHVFAPEVGASLFYSHDEHGRLQRAV